MYIKKEKITEIFLEVPGAFIYDNREGGNQNLIEK